MKKTKVAIIGTGNIGTDLLIKIQRSSFLECSLFAGRNLESRGMKIAAGMGVHVSDQSIESIIENPDCCEIVFDATSANIHKLHAPILKDLGKYTVDLTPSLIGKMCVPVINSSVCLDEYNVNMVTCGGQATVPIAYAITQVHPEIKYFEMVASIASKSAGQGTRANIDEFTQTTKNALTYFCGVENTKAIIILNPADPPILMHNTLYAMIDNPKIDLIRASVKKMELEIQTYVPGYKVTLEPVFESGRITTMVEVVGMGDYLPEYSGNLDIITCAAVNIAERYAMRNK